MFNTGLYVVVSLLTSTATTSLSPFLVQMISTLATCLIGGATIFSLEQAYLPKETKMDAKTDKSKKDKSPMSE